MNAYLQPSTGESGALRIRPGTHLGSQDDDVEVVLATEPGDVIAFDPRAQHGRVGRRRRGSGGTSTSRPSRTRTTPMAAPGQRDLVRELSDWPHPPEWPVWETWAGDRSSPGRATAIDRLGALGVL